MIHILTADQFSQEELLNLFQETKKIQEATEIEQTQQGNILATVFLEPSTRTRLSFETAMLRLGGKVISITNQESSSISKGESIEDTARVISIFADIIAIRTPEKGQVDTFSKKSSVPVINAGDGTGEHPTQHLLDLYTIWKEAGIIDGMTIGLMGDCKNSRVLRGLAKMSAEFDVKFIFIAPDELKMKDDVKNYLKEKGRTFKEASDIEEVIGELDVLDVNRVRHEYFEDKKRAKEIGEQFILTKEMVQKGKDELIVLDPLPRVNTVQEEVDELPQAKYFEAVVNGLYLRMALLNHLLT